MIPRLSQTQSQRLALSKNMLQSIKLLQMDIPTLSEFVNEVLQTNPALEEAFCEDTEYEEREGSFIWSGTANNIVCCSAEDLDCVNSLYDANEKSLQDYLRKQLCYLSVSKREKKIIDFLLNNMNEDGFLDISLKSASLFLSEDISIVSEAVQKIQALDPPGIGALSLRESLLIQAERAEMTDTVKKIIRFFLSEAASKKYTQIQEALGIDYCEVIKAVNEIAKLSPHPAAEFGIEKPVYIIPDVEIKGKIGSTFLLEETVLIPALKINDDYAALTQSIEDDNAKQYLNACILEAKSVIYGIEKRKKTFRECIKAIVLRQNDFFFSKGYLEPMTLNNIAEDIGVSISTVSRAIKNKYIRCIFGTIPISALFTSSPQNSKKVSSQEIKLLIKELVDSEDRDNPYSDQRIADLLQKKGITVARRTVSKYREKIGITPSINRKQ